jgi:hypothetical protein
MAGEFHRSLRGGGSRHIPMIGSFTGHYVGEILDTYQWSGVSQDTTWGWGGGLRHIPMAGGVSPVTTWGRFETHTNGRGNFTGHYVGIFQAH